MMKKSVLAVLLLVTSIFAGCGGASGIGSGGIGSGTGSDSVTPIGSSPGSTPVYKTYVYILSQATGKYVAFSQNADTGILTPIEERGMSSVMTSSVANTTGTAIYFTSAGSSSMSGYAINPSTGALTLKNSLSVGTGPVAMTTLGPNGNLYTANSTASTVTRIRTAADGIPSFGLPGPGPKHDAVGLGCAPESVVLHPTTSYLYVACTGTDQIKSYSVYPDGTLAGVNDQTVGDGPSDMALDPTGKYLYVTHRLANSVSVYSADSGGGLTHIETYALTGNPNLVSIHPSGKWLYVSQSTGNSVAHYDINSTNGKLTFKATIATASVPRKVAFEPTGKFGFIANFGSDTVVIYKVNQTTGDLSGSDSFGFLDEPIAITAVRVAVP